MTVASFAIICELETLSGDIDVDLIEQLKERIGDDYFSKTVDGKKHHAIVLRNIYDLTSFIEWLEKEVTIRLDGGTWILTILDA